MRSLKAYFFPVVMGAILLLSASLAQATEFTAKLIHYEPAAIISGGEKFTEKIFVKGDKVKIEKPRQKFIRIERPDKKVIWAISPQSKSYHEIPFNKLNSYKVSKEVQALLKKIGSEMVNGYKCDKFEVANQHVWISQKLDVPMKSMILPGHAGYGYYSELKDIKMENLDDSLFELPSGYRKMKLPGIPERKEEGGG